MKLWCGTRRRFRYALVNGRGEWVDVRDLDRVSKPGAFVRVYR